MSWGLAAEDDCSVTMKQEQQQQLKHWVALVLKKIHTCINFPHQIKYNIVYYQLSKSDNILSIPTSPLSKWIENSIFCTSFDSKTWITMLIITVPILVNALLPCHLMDPTLVVIAPLYVCWTSPFSFSTQYHVSMSILLLFYMLLLVAHSK